MSRAYSLLVMSSGDVATTHRLLPGESLTIGRDEHCDISVADASLSRRHAVIAAGKSGEVMLTDLGSRNGVRIGDRVVESNGSAPLPIGIMALLGGVCVILQARRTPQARARAFWTRAQFWLRVTEECARARAYDQTFGLMQVRGTTPAAAREILEEECHDADVLGDMGHGEYAVLLAGASASETSARETALRNRFRGEKEKVVAVVYPSDGTTAEQLASTLLERWTPTQSTPVPRHQRFDVTTQLATMGHDPQLLEYVAQLKDPATQAVFRVGRVVAASDLSVLIQGETGTGKDILARWVHAESPRRDEPIVSVNCAAFTANLLESELFGHERGAFTGATETKYGLLEVAGGGSVFLDEIGDMPVELQSKLLRVLEERKVRRIGGVEPIAIGARFIAATHHDLDAAIERGRFRRDLYYRLSGFSLELPPLRERTADILPLARYFISKICERRGVSLQPTLSEEFAQELTRYAWPGNIRELRNLVERAALLCPGEVIGMELWPHGRSTSAPLPTAPLSPLGEQILALLPNLESMPLKDRVAAIERASIVDALHRSGGVKAQAMRSLGKRTFQQRLQEFGLATADDNEEPEPL